LVWNEAHKLVLELYRESNLFPPEEKFGLTGQLRRSAASVCANLAEGCERKTTKEYLQFIYVSMGSLSETRYHMLLAKDLGYISDEHYTLLARQAELVIAYIQKLINSLENKLALSK